MSIIESIKFFSEIVNKRGLTDVRKGGMVSHRVLIAYEKRFPYSE
jgi:hypothetical protein